MATVGTLIFEMSANVARLQQDMDKAQGVVKGTMDSISSAVGTAKAAFAALGVAIGAHEFISFVESGISSVAMLERLSLQTGITVETLSALRGVAAAAGTSMDAVAGMVAKLEKNMLSFAQTGGGKAAEAFKALKMSQEEVAAGLKDMDAFLPVFAQKLLNTGVGGETVGLAMELIGKGASTALPFLNELAKAHELVATRTTEQAQRAHELEVEMSKVSQRSQLLKEDFAIGLTPALMQTVSAFNDLRTKGSGVAELGETLGTVLRYAAFAAGGLWVELQAVGKALGTVMAMADALAHGNLFDLKEIFKGSTVGQEMVDSLSALKQHLLEAQAPAEHVAEAVERQALAVKDVAAAEEDYSKLFAQDAANRLKSIDAETAEYEDQLRAIAKAQEHVQKTNDIGRELGLTFESAFENAIIRGKSFSDVLKGIEQDIERIIIRQAITKPVAAAISDATQGFSFGALFGGGKASGGPVSAGTSYLVGENGPEILSMGASSGNITPGGGGTTYIDARGADSMAVARIESGLRQLNSSIEHRAVAAVQRAFNQRGALTPMG